MNLLVIIALLCGIVLGILLFLIVVAVAIGMNNSVNQRRLIESTPHLVQKGPRCARRDCPPGPFFDGTTIYFNANLPRGIEEILIQLGVYHRIDDDAIVQPLVIAIHPEAAHVEHKAPQKWIDEWSKNDHLQISENQT